MAAIANILNVIGFEFSSYLSAYRMVRLSNVFVVTRIMKIISFLGKESKIVMCKESHLASTIIYQYFFLWFSLDIIS